MPNICAVTPSNDPVAFLAFYWLAVSFHGFFSSSLTKEIIWRPAVKCVSNIIGTFPNVSPTLQVLPEGYPIHFGPFPT